MADALRVDVREEESFQQMIEVAKLLFGRIDYFLNIAGVSRYKRLGSSKLKLWGGLPCHRFAMKLRDASHG